MRNKLNNIVLVVLAVVSVSSCAFKQEIDFQENNKVKSTLEFDMKAFVEKMKEMSPPEEGEVKENPFMALQDSMQQFNQGLDTLKKYGVEEAFVNVDSVNYTFGVTMLFKDMTSFVNFQNKDVEEGKKGVKINFDKKSFKVRDSKGMLPDQLSEMKDDSAAIANPMLDQMFTITSIYRFPYKIKTFKIGFGEATIGEDGKSLELKNSLTDFTKPEYNGDIDVTFE